MALGRDRLTNVGCGNTDPQAVAKTLDHNPAVADYALFGFDPSSNIAGHPVTTMYGFPGAEVTTLPLVEGRQAQRPGEVVLGASTADELAAAVGDRVPVRSQVPGIKTLKVVGIGVLPSLGPFLSDRTGPGTGAFALIDVDPANPDYQWPAALTAIRLKPSVDARAVAARNHDAMQGWDIIGQPPNIHTAPVRPAEIINAEGPRARPLVLGILLALGLAIGLACSIGVSVRDRRRELAILRSLGFSGRDLRATMAWQAVATITVGLVMGIPLGLVGGHIAWESFARQLGVVPQTDISLAWLAIVNLGSLAVALLAAWSPARSAAHITPQHRPPSQPLTGRRFRRTPPQPARIVSYVWTNPSSESPPRDPRPGEPANQLSGGWDGTSSPGARAGASPQASSPAPFAVRAGRDAHARTRDNSARPEPTRGRSRSDCSTAAPRSSSLSVGPATPCPLDERGPPGPSPRSGGREPRTV